MNKNTDNYSNSNIYSSEPSQSSLSNLVNFLNEWSESQLHFTLKYRVMMIFFYLTKKTGTNLHRCIPIIGKSKSHVRIKV